MKSGTLYIVATPIGNLEDMTFRGVRILKEVNLIAAEDTRHSRKLLNHFGISKPLTPYHDHNEQLKTGYLLEKLAAGQSIALITDAGTPCIADPGYRIVQAAVAAGIRVEPVPGASALISALSAAGLATDRFSFEGFLPPRQGKRKARLKEVIADTRLLVFYEAPHRLAATLEDMHEVLGARQAVVARELTKIHEEFRRGTLEELAPFYKEQQVKGEIVILVAPLDEPCREMAVIDVEVILNRLILVENNSVKDAVAQATFMSGISRNEIYGKALQIKRLKESS